MIIPTLLEESVLSVLILQNDRLAYVNPIAAALLGYSVAELLALPSACALVHQDDRGLVIDRLAELGQPGVRTLHLTIRGMRKDDSVVKAEAVFAVSQYLGQAATLVTVMEVGDRPRLEDQLRQAQKLGAVSQLAGGIAHAFNNLLASIRGNAELIGQQLGPEAPLMDEVAAIVASSDRAAGLTRELMAASQLPPLQPTALDLNGLVLSVVHVADGLVGPAIHLVDDLHSGLPPVLADPAALQQVLLHLIVHARDAMPAGGCIRIATAVEVLDEGSRALLGTGLAPGRYLRLTMGDGDGVEAAIQACLFEPVVTGSGPGQDTGLGLSTVHRLLHRTGGAITVAREPAQGAMFAVYLPAATEEHA